MVVTVCGSCASCGDVGGDGGGGGSKDCNGSSPTQTLNPKP